MSFIQSKKFSTWETGLLKMPRLETPRFQTAVKVTVTSGLCHDRLDMIVHPGGRYGVIVSQVYTINLRCRRVKGLVYYDPSLMYLDPLT